ncbi:MAG: hypothetical protein ACJ762_13810 [Solirubrobacteraceae bacterium]
MTRFSAVLAATTALALLPAAAGAKIIEIGETPTQAVPSCPTSPCFAVNRTTGYQAKVGTNRGLMTVPANGRIVAWTIGLSKPNTAQVKYFSTKLGGPAQAQITVLKAGKYLNDTVKAQGPLVALAPYFGSFAQFPLATAIPVLKGDVIALTVPTWAPALQVGLGGDTSWRASRSKNKCKDDPDKPAPQNAQLNVGDKQQYFCLYRTARLVYSATLVTYAKKTVKAPAKKSTRDSR